MNPKHTKQNFIMNFRVFERMKWKEVAGQAGADIYEYYTYKNEILKAKRKRLIGIIISQYPILVWKKTIRHAQKPKSKAIRKLLMRVLSNGKKKSGNI